jgi:hypothetical protein
LAAFVLTLLWKVNSKVAHAPAAIVRTAVVFATNVVVVSVPVPFDVL